MADVNGSSFHLLLTEQDWTGARPGDEGPPPQLSGEPDPDLEWSAACGLHLRRRLDLRRSTGGARLTPADRRGADRDAGGTWWVVGTDRRSLRGHREGRSTRAWPPPTCVTTGLFTGTAPPVPPAAELGGVVATDDHRLVVGRMDRPALLVFDQLRGGPPIVVRWTSSAAFHPVDLTRRPGGGVLVLDAAPGTSEGPRVWPLDDLLRPVLSEELPGELPAFTSCGQAAGAPVRRRVGARPWVLPVGRAVSIEALDDGTYLVLDVERRVVERYDGADAVDSLELDTALAGRVPPGTDPAVRGHDIAVGSDAAGAPLLFVSDRSGLQAFAFDLDGFAPRSETFPLRQHTGRALVGADGAVWFDTAERWHPLLARGRPRSAPSGTVETAALDGDERGCTWHRVLLDGHIPVGAAVAVESRAADDLAALAATPWRHEPSPYLRRASSDLPLGSGDARADRTGTWETLLQHTEGRYAQLRLTLDGAGGRSPEIAALRLVYPRFSYLHAYLPAVYAERDGPQRFLERYLANPEGILTDLEGRIADVRGLLDPGTAPARHLGWLGGWVGLAFDDDLPPRRRRLLIEHAIELHAQRGTVPGLLRLLLVMLSDCPEHAFDAAAVHDPSGIRIVEAFATRAQGVPVPGRPGEPGTALVTGERWTPALGGGELHRRWRTHLVERYGPDWSDVDGWVSGRTPSDEALSPTTPEDGSEAKDWEVFLAGQLGLRTVALGVGDVEVYRRYLLQRYRRIKPLAAAHPGTTATSFEEVALPTALPPDGPALEDWYQVIRLVVPTTRSAHRFTVLLPLDVATAPEEQERLVARARRVIEAARPAHTAFDVRPYWAAFQLGGARLGIDTRLGRSARFVAMVLGRGELARASLHTRQGART
jgi:phage tail-like protein